VLVTKKTKIKDDLPMCNCGSVRYTKVRMETMQTVFEHLDCNGCGKMYMVKRTRKEDALREDKEREEIRKRETKRSDWSLHSSRSRTLA
jgi:hypothetical protein